MKKTAIIFCCAFAFLTLFSFEIADAQKTYLLQYGTQDSTCEYDVDDQATFNLYMDNIPLPGSSIDIRNFQAHSITKEVIAVRNFDPVLNHFEMHIRQETGIVRLGYDFFQLPQMEDLQEILAEIIGEEFTEIDEAMLEPSEVVLRVTPQGQLVGLEFELPPEARMQTDMIMGMIENYLMMIMEPAFSQDPVSVGESWTQTIKLDKIPFAELPMLQIEYTLQAVENNKKKHEIARVSYSCDWRYDISAFNQFVVGETFEYYEDKEFKVSGFRPSVEVKVDGMYKFDLNDGYITESLAETEFVINIEFDLEKLSGHTKGEVWSPIIELAILSMKKEELR